jgi:hypothetical protein
METKNVYLWYLYETHLGKVYFWGGVNGYYDYPFSLSRPGRKIHYSGEKADNNDSQPVGPAFQPWKMQESEPAFSFSPAY